MATCAGLDVVAATADGALTVGGMPMQTFGWCVLDVTPLWGAPTVRGEDLLIPGMPGLMAMPRRVTGATVSLRMVFDGRRDGGGTPWAHHRDGLRRNLATVSSLVGGMPKNVTLMRAGGGGVALSGSAHVSLDHSPLSARTMRGVLTLNFPAGKPQSI